ncbi:MAG: DUF4375 domain-containing protein [Gemmataceae bacterium]
MRFLVGLVFFATTSLLLPGCSRTKSADLNKVLDTKDDFELCDELFKLMIQHYGEDFDVSKCNENDQTVILVWHATGIIDNGGFQFLFEGNLNGDLFFTRTVAAFKTIKAFKCAEAFDEALKLFPGSQPPQDISKRLKVYQAIPAAKRKAIDVKFFSESKEMPMILAKYIRENRAEFKHLK